MENGTETFNFLHMNPIFQALCQELSGTITFTRAKFIMASLVQQMAGRATELLGWADTIGYLCLADLEIRGTDDARTLLCHLKQGDVIKCEPDDTVGMISHHPYHQLPRHVLLAYDAVVESLLPISSKETLRHFQAMAASRIFKDMMDRVSN